MTDSIIGSIVAGAIGDAWGSCFENLQPPITFELPKQSSFTDDTQLTLATIESILESQCVNPESIAQHFLFWYKQKRIIGIGSRACGHLECEIKNATLKYLG